MMDIFHRVEEPMNIPIPNSHLCTADVMDVLRASGKPLYEWEKAIDGAPLLSARCGGDT